MNPATRRVLAALDHPITLMLTGALLHALPLGIIWLVIR